MTGKKAADAFIVRDGQGFHLEIKTTRVPRHFADTADFYKEVIVESEQWVGESVEAITAKIARRTAQRQQAADDLKAEVRTALKITGNRPIVTVSAPRVPPKGAAGMIAFFAPVNVREQLLGDLEEAYFDNVNRIGPRAAAWSYRYQVAAAAIAFLGPRILAWSGVAAVLKRFGAG